MARTGPDYIPRRDGNFTAWVNNYYPALKDWWLAHGFNKTDLAPLDDALSQWNSAWADLSAAEAAHKAAASEKNAARAALEPLVREFARIVQASEKTTNADRATLGLTVPDTTASPTPIPTTRPTARVDAGQRLMHRLRIADQLTPTSRAKPKGTAGAEVWLALVAVNQAPPPLPPSAGLGPSPYRYLELTSRGEALAKFKSSDAGKQACYALRWVSPRGEKGPWSEVASATIAA